MKVMKTKKRFEQIVGALLSVPKEEADAIAEAEQKARSKKRAGKAKDGEA